jgi:hypothetical protein
LLPADLAPAKLYLVPLLVVDAENVDTVAVLSGEFILTVVSSINAVADVGTEDGMVIILPELEGGLLRLNTTTGSMNFGPGEDVSDGFPVLYQTNPSG